MKYTILTLMCVAASMPLFAEEAKLDQPQEATQVTPMNAGPTAIITVDGLVCDFCAQSLERVFRQNPNVEKLEVDLTTKEASVWLKPGSTLTDEELLQMVTDSGYTASGIRR